MLSCDYIITDISLLPWHIILTSAEKIASTTFYLLGTLKNTEQKLNKMNTDY